MKFILSSTIPRLIAAAAALSVGLGGCSTAAPETAWGKAGVSRESYVGDLGTCMGVAGLTPVGNGSNTAGGLNGSNPESPAGNHSDYGRQQGGGGTGLVNPAAGGAVVTGGGGMYRDSTPTDVVNRAANQQQAQVMSAQRASTEALKKCYLQHGYQEFRLAPEQRRRLASLERGSNEYLAYLAEIGSDPAVLDSPPR
jgi:hypothetical protein